MSMFKNTHPELMRIGITIENVDTRYKPLMRMGISIDEMIYLARRLYPLIRDGKKDFRFSLWKWPNHSDLIKIDE